MSLRLLVKVGLAYSSIICRNPMSLRQARNRLHAESSIDR